MIASFGEVTFDAALAPEPGLARSRQATVARHELAGGPPVLETTGRDADQVELTVRLRHRWGDEIVDVEETWARLRALAGGEPRRLIIGDEVWGRFVLETCDGSIERMVGGRLEAVNVDCIFIEYH